MAEKSGIWAGVATIIGVLTAVIGGALYIADIRSRVLILEGKQYPSAADVNTVRDAALAEIAQATLRAGESISLSQQEATASIGQTAEGVRSSLSGFLNADGTINVGGICFRPAMLFRCARTNGDEDHLVWFSENECRGVMRLEGKVQILREC